MNIISSVSAWREFRQQLGSQSIGFVPTMGNLHAGHLSLCARSQAENEVTVVSIFINPTQFNQVEDFEQYPRTLEEDLAVLKSAGVTVVLTPSATEMYADAFSLQVALLPLPSAGEVERSEGEGDQSSKVGSA